MWNILGTHSNHSIISRSIHTRILWLLLQDLSIRRGLGFMGPWAHTFPISICLGGFSPWGLVGWWVVLPFCLGGSLLLICKHAYWKMDTCSSSFFNSVPKPLGQMSLFWKRTTKCSHWQYIYWKGQDINSIAQFGGKQPWAQTVQFQSRSDWGSNCDQRHIFHEAGTERLAKNKHDQQ